jgi:flagellar motor switch protein FliM
MDGMADERIQSVLRRKAEAGKPVADSAPMTPDRAITQALAKVAQDSFGLPLQVTAARESRMSLADLPEALEDLSLLAMIEGPGEALGLMVLPPATLSALIEMQTMGQLAKSAPAPRRATRIDASMAADFIDAVLVQIGDFLAETEAVIWAGGFRYASYLDDPRPLGLLLEDIGYRVWSLQLELGAGGMRQGGLLWVVPANGRGTHLRRNPGQTALAATAEGIASAAAERAAQEAAWGKQMQGTVMGTQAVIEAVLHRVSLPLSAVMALRPGLDIPLPSDALEHLRLEGAGRRRLSLGRLGQSRGMRAVRVIAEEDLAPGTMADVSTAKAKPAKTDPAPAFEAGASPFAGKPQDTLALSALGDPGSSLYDPPAGEGGEDADFPPLGMALDGFGATEDTGDLPPLKIGSGL